MKLSLAQWRALRASAAWGGVTSQYHRRSLFILENKGLVEMTSPAIRVDWGATYTATAAGRAALLANKEPCLVDFCRDCCPVLPQDADVRRTNGHIRCETCNVYLDKHPKYSYPSGVKHVHRGCDGVFYHL